MAKSIRSKWRRKNLKVKRVRYGKKELASLLAVVQKGENQQEVKDASDVIKAAGEKKMDVDTTETSEGTPSASGENNTETAGSTSLKSLIKKYGHVPKWVHPRKVKKIQRLKRRNEGKSKK